MLNCQVFLGVYLRFFWGGEKGENSRCWDRAYIVREVDPSPVTYGRREKGGEAVDAVPSLYKLTPPL